MTSPQTPNTVPFTGTTRNGESVRVVPGAGGWHVEIDRVVSGIFETIEQANVDADLYCPLGVRTLGDATRSEIVTFDPETGDYY